MHNAHNEQAYQTQQRIIFLFRFFDTLQKTNSFY